jgi:hypothetical protein
LGEGDANTEEQIKHRLTRGAVIGGDCQTATLELGDFEVSHDGLINDSFSQIISSERMGKSQIEKWPNCVVVVSPLK